MRPPTGKLYHDVFAVRDELYSFWDCNPRELQLQFLDGVDHAYFKYLADIHSLRLDGGDKNRAALALHTAYFHALETLFSLIFAGLFAPSGLPAWILKCKNETLRELVAAVSRNEALSNTRIRLEQYSWMYVSGLYNGVALLGNAEQDRTVKDIAELWHLFAQDFVDEFRVGAYNSFKHGFRVRLGGMKVAFAPHGPEGAPKPEDWRFPSASSASFRG